MKKLLITGATGFIGKALVNELLNNDFNLVASTRKKTKAISQRVKQVETGNILPTTNWLPALHKVDTVIHTAARVHILRDSSNDPLADFRKVNTAGTLNLAQQAIISGVARFIFISSIKVNGETTFDNQPFTANDNYTPADPYGLSKFEAERGLLNLTKNTSMELVIIRPPLVYGVGVKGNFAALIKVIQKSFPLPFGAIHNQRSLVALDNLVDFIICCIKHPRAANETFLISDGADLSTTELLQKIALAFNKRSLLFPVPIHFLTFLAKLSGNNHIIGRLFHSLQIDNLKANTLLNWNPVTTPDKQLKKIADTLLRNGG